MTNPMDTGAFALPPQVARLDAVRKLATRLTDALGLGGQAAQTIAEAVTDPAAVRTALTESLPGLTAQADSHLQVIPTRVWTPWVMLPADTIPRYSSHKLYPAANPSIPALPRSEETADGIIVPWKNPKDRAWHLADNEELYDKGDVHAGRLRIFPEKGGIVTPLVMVPQTEIFEAADLTGDAPAGPHPTLTDDGLKLAVHSLRVVNGRRRYYEIQRMLAQFAHLDEEALQAHLDESVTPDLFRDALAGDRPALTQVVRAVRAACTRAGDGNDFQQLIGVHFLATCLTLPAYIVVGTVSPTTSEVRPMGVGGSTGVSSTLSSGTHAWHTGRDARVVVTGQREYGGLLLPEAAVDTELITTATKRLRIRGVAKDVAEYGSTGRQSAVRFVWWCRAIQQLGGTPATAVAAFALSKGDTAWPQNISRPLLACASHLMEEDVDTVFPSGDYRDPETRPDSLTLLIADSSNLFSVAGVSWAGTDQRTVHAHPRFRNAAHIALAHLALTGALPAEEPLPERITNHARLLSHVAICWASNKVATFVRPSGAEYTESGGQPLPIDERTLSRSDLPWPKTEPDITYLTPPAADLPLGATHLFKLRHDVVYAIPGTTLDGTPVDPTPEAIAAVVQRWFPGATGVTLTDWSDKFITGVMVGSVWVRLNDRSAESEDARTRGVWYPHGRPPGTKDILDFESAQAGVPTGILVGAAPFVTEDFHTTWLSDVEETALREELDEAIIDAVDEALEAQWATDSHGGGKKLLERRRMEIPVLRLPDPTHGGRR